LARQRLERPRTAGGVVAWSTGDAIYGDERALRPSLEAPNPADVLAVSGKAAVWLSHDQPRLSPLLAARPAEGWERRSAGTGSQGARWDDWRRVAANAPHQGGWQCWVLRRRRLTEPTAVTAYIA
jgi:hypothetical protein